MKQLIILISLLLMGVMAYSQDEAHYCHDNAGNRVKRKPLSTFGCRLSFNESKMDKKDLKKPMSDEAAAKVMKYGISVSPNPTSSNVKLTYNNFNENVASKISVYSINGTMVSEQNVNSTITEVDFSSLNSGAYVLQLQTGEEKMFYKVVKE